MKMEDLDHGSFPSSVMPDEGLVLIPSSFPDSPAEVPAVVFQSRRS